MEKKVHFSNLINIQVISIQENIKKKINTRILVMKWNPELQWLKVFFLLCNSDKQGDDLSLFRFLSEVNVMAAPFLSENHASIGLYKQGETWF